MDAFRMPSLLNDKQQEQLDALLASIDDVEVLFNQKVLYSIALGATICMLEGLTPFCITITSGQNCRAGWDGGRYTLQLDMGVIKYYSEKGLTEYASIDDIWTYYKPTRYHSKEYKAAMKLYGYEAVWAMILHEVAHMNQRRHFGKVLGRKPTRPEDKSHKAVFCVELYKLIQAYDYNTVTASTILGSWFSADNM